MKGQIKKSIQISGTPEHTFSTSKHFRESENWPTPSPSNLHIALTTASGFYACMTDSLQSSQWESWSKICHLTSQDSEPGRGCAGQDGEIPGMERLRDDTWGIHSESGRPHMLGHVRLLIQISALSGRRKKGLP